VHVLAGATIPFVPMVLCEFEPDKPGAVRIVDSGPPGMTCEFDAITPAKGDELAAADAEMPNPNNTPKSTTDRIYNLCKYSSPFNIRYLPYYTSRDIRVDNTWRISNVVMHKRCADGCIPPSL
jgi:hypothetical protein